MVPASIGDRVFKLLISKTSQRTLANDPESIIMITSTIAYMSAGRSHLLQAGGESRPRAAGLDPRGGDIQAPLIIIILLLIT